MLDWHVREEDEPSLPDLLAEEPTTPPPRSWKRALIVLGLVLLLGGGILWWRLTAQEKQVQADLQNFVWQEERARLAGSPEQAEAFALPNAPYGWKTAYTATFGQPGGTVEAVEVEMEEFDGQCARVEVRLDGYPQQRRYCLFGGKWRRAPLSTDSWGQEVAVRLSNGVRFTYRERDAAFAERLLTSLPAYFNAQATWIAQRLGGGLNRSTVRYVKIVPHDGFGPLVSDEGDTIVLNSPLLTPYDGVLAPEARVRLALAQALLARAGPTPRDTRNLPGGERFVRAAHLVVAARVALTGEERRRLLEHWRRQLGDEWVSPFFAEWLTPERAHLADWSALWLVEWVYRQVGPGTLARLVHRLPRYSSWDDVFDEFLGRSTKEVEQAAASLVPGRAVGLQPHEMADESPFGAASLSVTLLDQNGRRRLLVEHPSVPHPFLVEASSYVGQYAARFPIQIACLGPGTRLTISGTWREEGYRFGADTLLVEEVKPPDYLLQEVLASGEAGASPIVQSSAEPTAPPDTVAYVALSSRQNVLTFAAVRSNGEVHTLFHPQGSLWLMPLAITSEAPLRLGVFYASPKCNWRWFTSYFPETGELGPLRSAPHESFVFWQPRAEQFLPVWTPSSTAPSPTVAVIMPDGEARLFALPPGRRYVRYVPLGWRSDTREIVMQTVGALSSPNLLRLLALTVPEGTTRWLELDLTEKPGSATLGSLSPDGRYVALTTTWQNVILWDLQTGAVREILVASEGERFEQLVWGARVDHPRLAVSVGKGIRGKRGSTVQVNRFVLISPDEEDKPVVIQVGAPQEGSFGLLGAVCQDGSLLYTVVTNGGSRPVTLYRQMPGNPPVELLTDDRFILPLACP